MAIDQQVLSLSRQSYRPAYSKGEDICKRVGEVMGRYKAKQIADFKDDDQRTITYRLKGVGFLIAKVSNSGDPFYSKGFKGLNGKESYASIAQLSFLGFDGKMELYGKIRSDLESSLTIPHNVVLQ